MTARRLLKPEPASTGDEAMIYHSGAMRAVVGIARVTAWGGR